VKALFLDRDGVINENRADNVLEPDQLRLLPASLEGLALLADSDLRVVVVTNQAAIGRGYLAATQLEAIHALMLKTVIDSGGRIDAVYVCPHRPEDGCTCRKPGTALLERAAAEHNLELRLSYFVGDSVSDLQAALSAGCVPVLVLTGRGRATRQELSEELAGRCLVARDLRDAVGLILASERPDPHQPRSHCEAILECAGT
jgi:D-glycero-D-manno-heptose 1,7-bisphosphate phosphatase